MITWWQPGWKKTAAYRKRQLWTQKAEDINQHGGICMLCHVSTFPQSSYARPFTSCMIQLSSSPWSPALKSENNSFSWIRKLILLILQCEMSGEERRQWHSVWSTHQPFILKQKNLWRHYCRLTLYPNKYGWQQQRAKKKHCLYMFIHLSNHWYQSTLHTLSSSPPCSIIIIIIIR